MAGTCGPSNAAGAADLGGTKLVALTDTEIDGGLHHELSDSDAALGRRLFFGRPNRH